MTEQLLSRLQDEHGFDLALAHLVDAGLDQLPHPGSGGTLQRWQLLAAVAAHDLSLVKLFEGHTDALAIQAELRSASPVRGSRWGTWCAEHPKARLRLLRAGAPGDQVRLHGAKAWCSGAASLTHALVTASDEAGNQFLAAVALDQPGVTVTDEGWEAVGMADCASVDVRFDDALAQQVGSAGDYVARPGFWQGGAGIAACWWGGAQGIARAVQAIAAATDDPHRRAHLGAIHVALAQAAALLRETAAWIDRQPLADALLPALRARLAVERCATDIVGHAGRAVGAGPLCRNRKFARAMADLPVFLRQSHAERDLATLGSKLLVQDTEWSL